MFPSLVHSLRWAAAVQRAAALPRACTLASSSRNKRPNVPSLPPANGPATPEQVAAVKERIVSPSNPRSRQYNKLDRRNFPSYSGLPVDDNKMDREPTQAPNGMTLYPSKRRYDTGVAPADMPFLHHEGHDDKPKPKFRSPRKRASKLFAEITAERIEKSKVSKPEVWGVPFKVGDAIEIGMLDEGGGVDNPQNKPLTKVRGVVLGRHNRGLDTGIYLADVVLGEQVFRKIKLHSPMVKTLRVLEEGFVQRGKKKGRRVKRAKLYYLMDRNPEETRVTELQRI